MFSVLEIGPNRSGQEDRTSKTHQVAHVFGEAEASDSMLCFEEVDIPLAVACFSHLTK